MQREYLSGILIFAKTIVFLIPIAPTVDSDKAQRGGSPPWCWDKATQSRLGVTAPQAMQSAAAQLIVVCKVRTISLAEAEPPQLLAPTVDSNKTERGGSPPWCWDKAVQGRLGVTVPQAMQSAAAQLIVVCKVRTISLAEAEPPQLLAPTVDSNETECGGHRPWCGDEAA
jgi:hypothetical protein